MSFLANKVRTITGSDVGLWKAAGRLLFFFLHPSRFHHVFQKFRKKILHKIPVYQTWILNQEKKLYQSLVSSENTSIRFLIIHHSQSKPEQSYQNVVYTTYEKLHQLEPLPSDYVIHLPPYSLLHPYACTIIAQTIVQSNLALVTFDCDQLINEQRQNPQFNKTWNPIDAIKLIDLGCVCYRWDLLNEKEKSTGKLSVRDSLFPIPSLRIKNVLVTHQSSYPTFAVNLPLLTENPLISIIIPTHNKAGLLKQCINSILEKSSYSKFEIIVINNNSTEPELAELLNLYKQTLNNTFVVIDAQYEFNFSQLMNDGVEVSKGDYVLLLNNDVEVISEDWIEQMLRWATQTWCGAVGSLLLYPDKKVQHAGVILNKNYGGEHIFTGLSSLNNISLSSTQAYSAVTAACLLVKKSTYKKAAGFDPSFKVEFNDLDFCLKLHSLGFTNVFTPFAQLYHYESASRQHPFSSSVSAKRYLNERTLFVTKWMSLVEDDPNWHPNRSLFGL